MEDPKVATVSPPLNEWSTKTFVDERSDKGIDDSTGKSVLPGDTYSPGPAERNRVVLPKEHSKGRDNVLPEPHYNAPGISEPGSGQKVPIRTLGKPGEEYGVPYKNNITPRRTYTGSDEQAGKKEVFPVPKQKEQGGKAKLYSHRYYQQNKARIKQRNKIRYDFLVRQKWFSRDEENRHDPQTERKFHRIPGGGVRSPAKRTEEWRKEHEASPHRVADFYRETDPFLKKPKDDQPGDSMEYPTPTYNDPYNFPDQSGTRMPGSTVYAPVPMGAPGSAKVIPEGFDFENKKAMDHRAAVVLSILLEDALEESFGLRVAVKMSELEQGLPRELVQRSMKLRPKLKRFDGKNGIWHFEVPGSEGKPYRIRVRALRKGNIKAVSKLHLQVDCSCDFWMFQGPEHWAMVGGYLYGKPRGTAGDPAIRDPDGKHKVCKHVLAVLRALRDVSFGGTVGD